jgi:serine protease AprX
MRKVLLSFIVLLSLVTGGVWDTPRLVLGGTVPPAKVARAAWDAAAVGTADVIVNAPGYPDLSPSGRLLSKEAKTRFVYETLTRYADAAQAKLRQALRARGTSFDVLWISNSLAVRGADRATLEWLSARPDVTRVDLDVQTRGIDSLEQVTTGRWSPAVAPTELTGRPSSVEWGVSQVNAPQVWALGYRGQNIVVADLDTGVQWDHPALMPTYRGWNGISATHGYNWYDAAYDQLGDTRSLAPADDDGHGTHTAGTIIGDTGTNSIGVAPDASWIACRNMRNGYGSVSRYTLCFQFALAPTDLAGLNPDPSKSADITSNSWSCWGGAPWYEVGCDVPSALITVTQALHDAGIMVVAAAGNEGSGCSTVLYSPGTYQQAFSIGATDSGNNIAGFSSRGPSTYDGQVKPDVVAPGVSVYSSIPGGGYGLKSGTSMATPHVAGVVALLWSAAPGLRGQVDETAAILRHTARPLTSAQTCGAVPGSSVPNNVYGFGLIDAQAAVSEALAVHLRLSAPPLVAYPEPVTLSVAMTNTSNVTRTNIVITVGVPASITVTSADGGLWSGEIITWSVAALGPQAALSYTVVLSAQKPGPLAFNDSVAQYDGFVMPRLASSPPATTLVFAHSVYLAIVLRS